LFISLKLIFINISNIIDYRNQHITRCTRTAAVVDSTMYYVVVVVVM